MLVFNRVNDDHEFSKFMISFGGGKYVPKFYFIQNYKNIKHVIKNSNSFQEKWINHYRIIGRVDNNDAGFDTVILTYLNNESKNRFKLGDFINKYYNAVVKNNKIPFTISINNSSILAFWEGDVLSRYFTMSTINLLKKYKTSLTLEQYVELIKTYRSELLQKFLKNSDIIYYATSLAGQVLFINPHMILNTVWFGNNILIQVSDYTELHEFRFNHKLFPNADEMSLNEILNIKNNITHFKIGLLVDGKTLREVLTGEEKKVTDESLLTVVDGYNYYIV